MIVAITQLDTPPPFTAAVATGIAAQAGGQASATPLTARRNIVTLAAAGDAVALGVILGNEQKVFNATAVALGVYPPSGTQVQGLGLNVPYQLAAGAVATFTFDGISTFYIG